MYRTQGKQLLGRFVRTPSNIDILEKYIFNTTEDAHTYFQRLYECLGKLMHGESLRDLLTCLYKGEFGWEHAAYATLRAQQEEEDTFTTTPLEVEEGILECNKCGSKKTFSYQKQTRSIDEGATTFAQCVVCKNRWRHNN